MTSIPADGNVEGSLSFDCTEDDINGGALNSDGINEGSSDGLLDLDGTADGWDDGLLDFDGTSDCNLEGLLHFDGTKDGIDDDAPLKSDGVNKGKFNCLYNQWKRQWIACWLLISLLTQLIIENDKEQKWVRDAKQCDKKQDDGNDNEAQQNSSIWGIQSCLEAGNYKKCQRDNPVCISSGMNVKELHQVAGTIFH
jgi:hypothetical protein